MVTFLLFGATGLTGKHVLTKCLNNPNTVDIVVFARTPSKIPEEQRNRVKIIEGDLTDVEAVKNAVKSSKPDVIISTASLGFTNKMSKLKEILNPAIVCGLREDGRLAACKFINLSGCSSPIPPDSGNVCSTFMSFMIPLINLKAEVYDNSAAHRYIITTPDEFRFTNVSLGGVSEGKSKGKLKGRVAKTGDFGQGFLPSSMCFEDVGEFLRSLAVASVFNASVAGAGAGAGADAKSGEGESFDRQFIVMEYV